MQALTFTEKLGEILFPRLRERRNLLEREATTDRLTGLGNRAAFDRAEPQALLDGLSFIIFDANNFGRINKQCGHRRGNEVLQQFSDVIADVAEKYKARAFRYGGDEFVIIAGSRFAARVRDAVEAKIRPLDFGNFVVSVSGETGSSVEDADSRLQARKCEAKKNAR